MCGNKNYRLLSTAFENVVMMNQDEEDHDVCYKQPENDEETEQTERKYLRYIGGCPDTTTQTCWRLFHVIQGESLLS